MDPAKRYKANPNHPAELVDLLMAIEDNLDKELKIPDFAEITGLSVDKIYRLGRKYFPNGIGPHEWHCMRRLYEARKILLLNSKIPIKEVASMFGFDSPSWFTKRYRLQFAETPSQTKRFALKPTSLR